MVEVAEELVEAVDCGKIFVAVPQMILAELTGRVLQLLQQNGDRRVQLLMPIGAPGKPTLVSPVANAVLAGDERGATRGARLFAIVMQEANPFVGHSVDVGRGVSHQTIAVGADVADSDVVAQSTRIFGFLTFAVGFASAALLTCATWTTRAAADGSAFACANNSSA